MLFPQSLLNGTGMLKPIKTDFSFKTISFPRIGFSYVSIHSAGSSIYTMRIYWPIHSVNLCNKTLRHNGIESAFLRNIIYLCVLHIYTFCLSSWSIPISPYTLPHKPRCPSRWVVPWTTMKNLWQEVTAIHVFWAQIRKLVPCWLLHSLFISISRVTSLSPWPCINGIGLDEG